MNKSLCRCGSNMEFSHCCEPFVTHTKKPETAEQLMRSRFTAFCLQNCQYLVDTHHPSKRSSNDLSALQNDFQTTSWLTLTVHNSHQGGSFDDIGTVEFSAVFHQNNQFYELRETSSFIKQQQWFYLNGEPQIKPFYYKIKRNQSCWCLSGKKFKHCHARL
jgi:SEC-C motif-containing protein